MNKKILSLIMLISISSIESLATTTPWVFTSIVPSKKEMINIPRKETCRPFTAKLMPPHKCVQYKRGYVCPQEDSSQTIISTYSNKGECTKALSKARRLLAKK